MTRADDLHLLEMFDKAYGSEPYQRNSNTPHEHRLDLVGRPWLVLQRWHGATDCDVCGQRRLGCLTRTDPRECCRGERCLCAECWVTQATEPDRRPHERDCPDRDVLLSDDEVREERAIQRAEARADEHGWAR